MGAVEKQGGHGGGFQCQAKIQKEAHCEVPQRRLAALRGALDALRVIRRFGVRCGGQGMQNQERRLLEPHVADGPKREDSFERFISQALLGLQRPCACMLPTVGNPSLDSKSCQISSPIFPSFCMSCLAWHTCGGFTQGPAGSCET